VILVLGFVLNAFSIPLKPGASLAKIASMSRARAASVRPLPAA
jgi:hypothetical protein